MTLEHVDIPAELKMNGKYLPRWFRLMNDENEDAIIECAGKDIGPELIVLTIMLEEVRVEWDLDKWVWPDWLELAVRDGAVSIPTMNALMNRHESERTAHNEGWVVDQGLQSKD